MELTRDSSGQAVTEYLLLLVVVVSVFLILSRGLKDMNLAAKLGKAVTGGFASAYRYGHPKAKGYDDDGGPEYHPRALEGGTNFRLFINPER